MKSEEFSERYQIPMQILKEYESWQLCGAVRLVTDEWRYDNQDLERLSMIMALHDIGFSSEQVEIYMRMLLIGDSTKQSRLRMLGEIRSKALDEIHLREQQLIRMDYLRHELRNEK